MSAGAGTLVAALRGCAHGFRNAGDAPATAICLYTPGGYEEFFADLHRAVAEGAEPTPEPDGRVPQPLPQPTPCDRAVSTAHPGG
ncbi:hypothetical protein G5V59_21205 [Nocardioides sp. W3-2-3]|uniref:hypothetical protein n=1 Tax=Nocardioides convexus TaxID=2712224 RepID=UPI00241889DE|nr:hypothetical protein [Nocardioides convexus]NHA01474.1 hypothetical protein [Nocardioides convexus]